MLELILIPARIAYNGAPPFASEASMWQRTIIGRSFVRLNRHQPVAMAQHHQKQPVDPDHLSSSLTRTLTWHYFGRSVGGFAASKHLQRGHVNGGERDRQSIMAWRTTGRLSWGGWPQTLFIVLPERSGGTALRHGLSSSSMRGDGARPRTGPRSGRGQVLP